MLIGSAACRASFLILAVLFIPAGSLAEAAPAAGEVGNSKRQPNVLLISVDDLAAELGSYGNELVKSPNIDALAGQGVRFDRAYTQYTVCNPSRISFLTGQYPGSTGVRTNRTWFRDTRPDIVTIPQHLRASGYITLRTGKIFHDGYDDHLAWVEGGDPSRREPEKPIPEAEREARRAAFIARVENFPWRAVGDSEAPELPDVKATDTAISYLEKYKDKPFFLAIGYRKPHTPFVCPKKYVDLYDLKNIPLPANHALRPTAGPGVPKAAVRDMNADLFVTAELTPGRTREALAAYYGCVSFIEAQHEPRPHPCRHSQTDGVIGVSA